MTKIVVDSLDEEDQKAGWELTEWMGDLDVMITQTDKAEPLSDANSAMYSKETYYYNRDTDDGNVAGRVPLKQDKAWHLTIISYNEEEEQSLIV